MKGIRHILPLYVGQKVGANGQYFPLIPEMVNVLLPVLGAGEYNLYLRPLSSMTEEEAKEICRVMGWSFEVFVSDPESKHVSIYQKEGVGIWLWEDGIIIPEMESQPDIPMLLIPLLAFKGFDCFDLIGQGIAKDVTQISQ